MAQRITNNGSKPTHDDIARRAREIYERSGRIPGRDLENWLEAESQLLAASRRGESNPKAPSGESKPSPRPVAKQESRA